MLYGQYKISLDRNSPSPGRKFAIKYTKEQRLDIWQRIYDGKINCYEAAEEF